MIVRENSRASLATWIENYTAKIQPKFSSHLFSESDKTVLHTKEVLPTFDNAAEDVDARLVLRDNFDAIFAEISRNFDFW